MYLHEMPGGQYTNLREQAEAMGLGARWPEIAADLCRRQLGVRRHRESDSIE